MTDDEFRDSRQMLRRVQEHLCNMHLHMGAQCDSAGLVNVIHHPQSAVPALNYVTPRQKTSWIPTDQIELGLSRLNELHRTRRVMYIEGLFPPPFGKTLLDLGLKPESQTPLVAFSSGGASKVILPKPPPTPDSVVIAPVQDPRSMAIWWYTWRNAHYEVVSTGADPFAVGWEMAAQAQGHQLNILVYRYNFPVGALRLTFAQDSAQQSSAYFASFAIMKEARTPDLLRLLRLSALKLALQRGCSLVFAPAESADEQQQYHELGFVDSGSIVCYAASANTITGTTESKEQAERTDTGAANTAPDTEPNAAPDAAPNAAPDAPPPANTHDNTISQSLLSHARP